MMAVEAYRSLHQSHAAFPLSGVCHHDSHISQGGAVARIERYGPIRGIAKGDEISTEEVHQGEELPAHLTGGIDLHGPPCRLPCPLDRSFQRIEAIAIL